jgi:hypothetical protein
MPAFQEPGTVGPHGLGAAAMNAMKRRLQLNYWGAERPSNAADLVLEARTWGSIRFESPRPPGPAH